MAEERVQRRLAAILAADVVGYSRLMGEDEEGTLATLTAHLTELIEPCIGENNGRVVKTTGDGLLAEFASVVDAMRCAVAFQEGMSERNTDTPEDRLVEFRIGVNLGDVIVQDDDVFGDGVNVAARLEELADPGGVIVSSKVQEEVRTKLDLSFDDLGLQEVKNIADPVQAFRVTPAYSAANSSVVAAQTEDVFKLPSIAILPLQNMSGDPNQEYFSDGITEDLITALSRMRQFRVVARNSSFTFKNRIVNVLQVANELGVRYVVEGSVRKAGNRVRVSAQLVDGLSGNHVWAERYDREIEDIFELQDDLAETLAGAIEPELLKSERSKATSKPAESLDAWDCYQRGMSHLNRLAHDDLGEAWRLFNRAIALDPNFSPSYSAVVWVSFFDILYGFQQRDPEEVLRAARKAIDLDSQDPEAHLALGIAHLMMRNHGAAITACRTAIQLNPSHAWAHHGLARCLIHSGRPHDAKPHILAAIRLSPLHPETGRFYGAMALAHLLLTEFDDSLEWGMRAIEQPGVTAPVYVFALSALGHLDRKDKAKELLSRLMRMDDGISISGVQKRTPIARHEDMDTLLDGLRKAGLPE